MVTNTVIFANAVATYNEGKLLDREKIRRLTEAEFSDAVKMLIDYGYGGGVMNESNYDVDAFIAEETNRLIDFIEENSPIDHLSACLTNRYLYSNAKAAAKNKYAPFDIAPVLFAVQGTDEVIAAVESGDFSALPAHMAAAMAEISERFAEKPADPVTVDLLLTKAMFADNVAQAASSKSKIMQQYVRAEIDLVNLSALLRSTALGMSAETLALQLIAGGSISEEDLLSWVGFPPETVAAQLGDTPYGEIVRAAEKNMAQFETDGDDYLYLLSAVQRDNMTSLSPMLSYVFARQTEFKTVKMILVCLKNGARDKIAERLRGLYA